MRLLCLVALILQCTNGHPSISASDHHDATSDKDSEAARKLLGSSVVTSVSVILNGNEPPQYSDAIGQRIPKPQEPLQVASPINLLNPDRYEFYTFDKNGQLVKRIMTLKEIHSIVANGDSEGSTIIHNPSMTANDDSNSDAEKNVQDIVNSVQNVLTKEVEWKNNSSNLNNQMLDTPDVSSSWSMILPAIFGNTGDEIFPNNHHHHRPQQVVMTPDSDVLEVRPTKPNRKPSVATKRRPTIASVQLVDENDLMVTAEPLPSTVSQKIFMNNQEIIKPLFNRNDVKSDFGELFTTTMTSVKPTVHTTPSTTAATTTTTTPAATTSKVTKKSSTKRPYKNKPTKSSAASTIHDHPESTTKRVTNKRKPTTGPIHTTTRRVSTHNRRPTSGNKQPTKRTQTTKRNKPTTAAAAPASSTHGYYPTTTPHPSAPSTTKKNKRKHGSNAPSKGEPISVKHKKRTTTTHTPVTTTTPPPPPQSTTPKVGKRKPTKHPATTTTHQTTSTVHTTTTTPHTTTTTPYTTTTTKKYTTTTAPTTKHTTTPYTTKQTTTHGYYRPSTTPTTTTTTKLTTTTKKQSYHDYQPTNAPHTTAHTTIKQTTSKKPITQGYFPTTSSPTTTTTTKHTTPQPTPSYQRPTTVIAHTTITTKKPPTTAHTTLGYHSTTAAQITTASTKHTTTPTTPTTTHHSSKKPHTKPHATTRPAHSSTTTTTSSKPTYSPSAGTSHHHTTGSTTTTHYPKTKHPSHHKNYATTINNDFIVDAHQEPLRTDAAGISSAQQDDMNTKLSFDQIMQSLKNENEPSTDRHKIAAAAAVTPPTKQPVSYSNNNLPLTPDRIQVQQNHLPSITTSTENLIMMTTLKLQNDSTDQHMDVGANVVKFEPLYAELLEPILTQLTTEIPTTIEESSELDFMTTTTDENFKEISDDAIKRYEEINIETINPLKSSSMESTSSASASVEDETTTEKHHHKNELTQRIEEFITNNMQYNNNDNEKIFINAKNPSSIPLQQQMSMQELQKESATLASMLEEHNTMVNNKLNIITPPPPPTATSSVAAATVTSDNEIENLLSQVYNQMTDAPLPTTTKIPIITTNNLQELKQNDHHHNNDAHIDVDKESSSNRFTNIAKMNDSLLVPPPQEITPQLNSNDKFYMMETLALKLNEKNNNSADEDDDDADSSSSSSSSSSNVASDDIDESANAMQTTTTMTDNDDNVMAFEVENYSTASNLMNSNTNAIETKATDTTTAAAADYSTEKIDDSSSSGSVEENLMENDANISTKFSSLEIYDNNSSNGNDGDSEDTSETIKEIESLIETTTAADVDADDDDKNVSDISTEINSKISDDENLDLNSRHAIPQATTTTTNVDDSSTEKFNSDENLSTEKFIVIESSQASQESLETTTATQMKLDLQQSSEELTETPMELVELIPQPATHKTKVIPTQNSNIFNITEKEQIYEKLGETMSGVIEYPGSSTTIDSSTIKLTIIPPVTMPSQKKKPTLKPVHYYKQPTHSNNDHKLIGSYITNQRPVVRPASLTNLKITQISNTATRTPVKLEPSPTQSLGLIASTMDLQEDVQEFARLCNELAFNYWRSITSEKISNARSCVMSPFALTSMLAMVFLGARGGTSGEMNEVLRLDDMVTFNPHLVFKNITESVENAKDSEIASSAFVREIYSDRANGKILPFFKDKTQQFYSGHVEEVNFNVVNDIIRRRTNLLVKRHTNGKVNEYLRTNSVWVNGPLSTVSANLFQTDCSRGSVADRDGEMFFQVHPSVRQRRLVPVPAVVWRSGFTAGYDTELDATAVAFGNAEETVSTIYVMPGQHGLANPGDTLERLEKNIMENGVSKNVWSHLLSSLMHRPGLEVQLPRFSHRSFVNASIGLQKLGLKALFDSDNADLRGLTGSSNKDVFISDMIQINTFSTCGEEKIGEHHHVEMYPAPPLRKRNSNMDDNLENESDMLTIDDLLIEGKSGKVEQQQDSAARGFYDDLLDPKYLELPLPLRPRQARIPDAPRLRFDKPFLYFVRHNPTGMILFMGRFNPRLLP